MKEKLCSLGAGRLLSLARAVFVMVVLSTPALGDVVYVTNYGAISGSEAAASTNVAAFAAAIDAAVVQAEVVQLAAALRRIILSSESEKVRISPPRQRGGHALAVWLVMPFANSNVASDYCCVGGHCHSDCDI